jgi:hypothetical protein
LISSKRIDPHRHTPTGVRRFRSSKEWTAEL